MSFDLDEPVRRPRMSGKTMFLVCAAPLALTLVANILYFGLVHDGAVGNTQRNANILAACWVASAAWFFFGGILSLFVLLSRRR